MRHSLKRTSGGFPQTSFAQNDTRTTLSVPQSHTVQNARGNILSLGSKMPTDRQAGYARTGERITVWAENEPITLVAWLHTIFNHAANVHTMTMNKVSLLQTLHMVIRRHTTCIRTHIKASAMLLLSLSIKGAISLPDCSFY